MPEGVHKGKTSKAGPPGLETRNRTKARKLVEYHPIFAEDLSRLHQFGPKVLPGIFFGYVLYAGGIWKGDIMVADIEELDEIDASEVLAKRLKGSVNAHEWWTIHISKRGWNNKTFWVRSGSENIHFNLGQPRQRRRTR